MANKCVKCLKNGETGDCYDIMDETARNEIETLKEDFNSEIAKIKDFVGYKEFVLFQEYTDLKQGFSSTQYLACDSYGNNDCFTMSSSEIEETTFKLVNEYLGIEHVFKKGETLTINKENTAYGPFQVTVYISMYYAQDWYSLVFNGFDGIVSQLPNPVGTFKLYIAQ